LSIGFLKKVLTPAVATSAGVKLTIKGERRNNYLLLQREQAIALLHNLMTEHSATLKGSLAGADRFGTVLCHNSRDFCVGSRDGTEFASSSGCDVSVAVLALHN
jgi:hypothetical protein